MESPPASWVVPKRTIVMATLPRTGSYWLSELMAQTDKLGRPGAEKKPAQKTAHVTQ